MIRIRDCDGDNRGDRGPGIVSVTTIVRVSSPSTALVASQQPTSLYFYFNTTRKEM